MTDAELAEANLLDTAAELLETNTLADGYLIVHPDDPEYLPKLTEWVAEEGYDGEYGERVVAKMEELRGGVVIDGQAVAEELRRRSAG